MCVCNICIPILRISGSNMFKLQTSFCLSADRSTSFSNLLLSCCVAAPFGTGSMSMPAGFGNAAAYNLPTSFSGTFQQPFPGQAPFPPQPPAYPPQPNGVCHLDINGYGEILAYLSICSCQMNVCRMCPPSNNSGNVVFQVEDFLPSARPNLL